MNLDGAGEVRGPGPRGLGGARRIPDSPLSEDLTGVILGF